MWRIALQIVGLILWVVLSVVTLVSFYETRGHTHWINGLWGSGPPTEELLGHHAFSFVVLGLPALGCAYELSGRSLRRLGWVLMGTGVLLVLAVCAFDLWYWLPKAGKSQRHYILQRIGFAAVTYVKVPGLEILGWSLILLCVGVCKGIVSRKEGCELQQEKGVVGVE